MKDRIKKVRKDASETQAQFATKLNLSRNYVFMMESGDREPSDRTVKDICSKYKVAEHWLRTGKGDPYPTKTDNQRLAEFINNIMEDEDESFRRQVILAATELSDEDWDYLRDLIHKLSKKESR